MKIPIYRKMINKTFLIAIKKEFSIYNSLLKIVVNIKQKNCYYKKNIVNHFDRIFIPIH